MNRPSQPSESGSHGGQTPSPPHAIESTAVGRRAPQFTLPAIDPRGLSTVELRSSDYDGQWLMLIFYPRDFSFVCPTELTAFSQRISEFHDRNCQLIGVSVDSLDLHREWLRTPADRGGLGRLQFPLASDPSGNVARAFGVWHAEKQVSTRGLFILDPQGLLQYSVMHNLNVGRSPDEVLRVLEALQTGRLCPASWTSSDGTIEPEQALRQGRILGHYRIRRIVGSGTFGTVFAAKDLRLERTVALKVLKKNLLDSHNAVLAEARAAARLNHPNLCTVYNVEEVDGLPVISMEYLRGQTLAERIEQGLPRDLSIRVAQQIAAGLAAAHEHDLVHGDLKPANIILASFDTPKILDFGLSTPFGIGLAEPDSAATFPASHLDSTQILAAGDDPDATVERATSRSAASRRSKSATWIRGTPAYMSPEQAVGRPPAPASDVFAFGLILYEMFTGQQALAEEQMPKLIEMLQQDDLHHRLARRVPTALQSFVTRALDPDPQQRPSSGQLANELLHFSFA